MPPDRPTFSPFWHRVRALKPRLRPHVQITRQHYRGRRWHVVHDPASNQFYRLSPIAHELVSMLDGARSVEESWNLSLETHGDDAPTQPEVIELLGQMYNSNLLALDTSPETEQLLSRGRERTKRRLQQQAIGIMYFKIKLFNPDGYLSWLQPILRPLLNRWGLILWAGLVVAALANLLPHWRELVGGAGNAVAPGNWIWLLVSWVFLKAIHETGHGVICKHFGGQVPEFGVMLLVLLPSPYVDASSAWALSNKWRRMAVGAGGMLFETFIAGLAAFAWLATRSNATESGQLIHLLAYNAMLTSGISTILFNANPLMRFDGYYILSDLLEVPNLMQRSQKQLGYLFQRYVYRLENARAATSQPSERRILVVFGVLSMIYRVFLFFGITLYVMGQFFALGLILAVWSAAAWILLPLGKFVHWLATSPALSDRRPQALVTTLGMAAFAFFALGIVSFPDRRHASGVVESEARSGVYFGTDGFIQAVHKRAGERVKKGEAIVTLVSPELEAELIRAGALVRQSEGQERQYLARGVAAGVQIANQSVVLMNNYRVEVERRLGELVVRAPQDGVVAGQDPGLLLGMYARRGQLACEVVDDARVRVAAALTQAEASWLYDLRRDEYAVAMRRIGRPREVAIGGEVEIPQAGQTRLPHESLGAAGGGAIEVDPQDRSGRTATTARFIVRIKPALGEVFAGLPGEPVGVRFTLPSKPLLVQWADRFRKLIQGRVQV
jgi:putative peptide zinc metalloprotease protein